MNESKPADKKGLSHFVRHDGRSTPILAEEKAQLLKKGSYVPSLHLHMQRGVQ